MPRKTKKAKAENRTKRVGAKLYKGGELLPVSYRRIDFDVWGNDLDGYYVATRHTTEKTIDLTVGDNGEIISKLKENKFLSDKATPKNIEIYGELASLFFVDAEKGYPLFELVCVEKFKPEKAKSEFLVEDIIPIQTETQTQEKTDVTIDENGKIILPDYDITPDNIIEKHFVDDEIYYEHLKSILGRTPMYEECVGKYLLRKCFLRPYYKIIR